MGLGKRIFIALTLTLVSTLCYAQKPNAHFTSDCKILCLGSGTGQIGDDEVGFLYDGTGGTPSTYAWSVTPSTNVTIPSPSAANPGTMTFKTAGQYLVKVTATNGSGSTSFTDTIFAINTCSANVLASSSTICPGTCISFKDQSNFRPDTWSWTFPGEGIAAPGDTSYHQNPPSICYPNTGKFTVNLTASRTNSKCFNQASFSASLITVKNCPPVVFTINASKTSLCKGDCINFTSHITSGTGPFTYSWTFLNGGVAGSSTDSLPNGICYNTIGNNLVATLVVTDAVGKTSSENISIDVVSCVPTADFSPPPPICAGQCITYKDLSTAGAGANGKVTGWSWNFQGGNLTTSSSQNPAVCYTTAGTYTTTLVASNASGSSPVFSQQVIVNSCPPTADFSFTPDNFCQNGCVTFTDHSVGGSGGKILTWNWAFQNPNGGNPIIYTKDSLPPPLCYPTEGAYTVGLVVTNASGPSAPFTQTVNVRYCPPPLNINFTTSSGQATIPSNDVCRDSCIRIVNNTTGATNYLWEFIYKDSTGATHDTTFNGANPPDAPGDLPNTPPACFAVPIDTGFIHIILFASSQDSTKTLDQLIHVHLCSGMFPALKPSDPTICAGDCISFLDETTVQGGIQPPVGWVWIFAGGSPDTSTVQNPPYICYQNPGIYPVKLKVFNSTTSDSVMYNSLIIVNQPSPVGTSFDSTTVVEGTSVQLYASGGVSYAWTPPTNLDFAFSNNPLFYTVDTGLYKYTVEMVDANGCSSDKSIEINVIPPDLVMAPNVFTPNGDGINDKFRIYISGAYASMELHVYDRWGEKIFSTTNDGDLGGWDGTYKGRLLNDDVYVYYYKVTFKDGTVLKQSGDITLLR